MILGFTGTREGMTDVQREAVAEYLRQKRPAYVHHGDCIGADSQFHDSALVLLPRPPVIVVHPCTLDKYRANRKGDVVYPVKPPLERNADIVKVCDELLAAPKSTKSSSGGTWYTIRLALKARKMVTVAWPDGTTTVRGYASLAEIFGQ